MCVWDLKEENINIKDLLKDKLPEVEELKHLYMSMQDKAITEHQALQNDLTYFFLKALRNIVSV